MLSLWLELQRLNQAYYSANREWKYGKEACEVTSYVEVIPVVRLSSVLWTRLLPGRSGATSRAYQVRSLVGQWLANG